MILHPSPTLKTQAIITVPGDKSISHRALMFNALATGTAHIENMLMGEDVLCTLQILRQLGVPITLSEQYCIVEGVGGHFQQPSSVLYCGNSGTTMRLMLGLLAPQPISVILTGDASLQKRPMDRVTHYLRDVGVSYPESDNLAPIIQQGCTTIPHFDFTLHIASAQMKSALLLAAVQSAGGIVRGGKSSRDHTEKMLKGMGASVLQEANGDVQIQPSTLKAQDITVPNDISSAAFFMVAAVLSSQTTIELPNVGLNPTRAGIIHTLQRMGASVTIVNQREMCGELVGDVVVYPSCLTGITLNKDTIPTMIDELPILALAATQAYGTTIIRGAADLRKKESDRIHSIVQMFKTFGVDIVEYQDGFSITGPQSIQGGKIEGFGDHRIIMTAAIASLISENPIVIENVDAVNTSFPNFWELFVEIGGRFTS